MFHELFRWLQEDLGATADASSWTDQFRGSLNLWGLMEGTHVLTLMVFAGTIWLVDMRMLGVAFRATPFSRLNAKILPYTTTAFAVMIVTGIILFLAKPMDYYHNVWFRIKMIFLILAAANIFWFHHSVQKTESEWDEIKQDGLKDRSLLWVILGAGLLLFFGTGSAIIAATIANSMGVMYWLLLLVSIAIISAAFWMHHKRNPEPPLPVKLSGAFSLTAWILIIIFGRFIAYNWFECGKPLPGFINWAAECSTWPGGALALEPGAHGVVPLDGAQDPADGAEPGETAPADMPAEPPAGEPVENPAPAANEGGQ